MKKNIKNTNLITVILLNNKNSINNFIICTNYLIIKLFLFYYDCRNKFIISFFTFF